MTVFILKYRLAQTPGYKYTVEGEAWQTRQRAIRIVRARAREWGINPTRVGLLGFSAGGALAGLADIRFDRGKADATDPIERESCRPDFVGLVYAGWAPMDITAPSDAAPAFLISAGVDDASHARQTVEFLVRYSKSGVPADLHIYGVAARWAGSSARRHPSAPGTSGLPTGWPIWQLNKTPPARAVFQGPLGLQLYSLREQFARNVPATIDVARGFGIEYVELAGTYNIAPEEFKRQLTAKGLKPVSGHFPYERFRDNVEAVATEAGALGLQYVGCAWIPHQDTFDEKTAREAAAVFNRAATRCQTRVEVFSITRMATNFSRTATARSSI